MSRLADEFEQLGRDLRELIALLEEAEADFWLPWFRRGLAQVDEHRLAGATFVLGCYGGADTFSDLVLGTGHAVDSLDFRNLNARLDVLRTRVFESANAITARRSW